MNELADWVEKEGELMLSNYNSPQELRIILEKNIELKIK